MVFYRSKEKDTFFLGDEHNFCLKILNGKKLKVINFMKLEGLKKTNALIYALLKKFNTIDYEQMLILKLRFIYISKL